MPTPVEKAVEILRAGGLVVIPTETVYGLAADAENEWAVRQIFALKGRPSTHPLIVHLPNFEAVLPWVEDVPDDARKMADAFWPGPLTLILKKSQKPSDGVTGGQTTVGIRVPNHPLTLELLKAFGGGLAAPSANKFGGVSPTTAAHVQKDLGVETPFILDGGPCAVGVESTIVDLSRGRPMVLRPGGISKEALEAVLSKPVELETHGKEVRASGTLESHYAPRAGLVLAEEAHVRARVDSLLQAGKKVAAWVKDDVALSADILRFSLPEKAEVLAQSLYETLRRMDESGVDVIVTTLPPSTGLHLAVLDRLKRAAAPRSQ